MKAFAFGWSHIRIFAGNVAAFAETHASPLNIAALIVIAGIGIALAVVSFAGRGNEDLDEMLRPYRLLPQEHATDAAVAGVRPLIRRFSERLAAIVEARGLGPALESRLERSGLALSSGEFLLICLVSLVIPGILGALVGKVAGAIAGLAIGALTPHAVLQVRIERRQRAFGSQLPDLLKLLASSLRAGFSFLQCLAAVTAQSAEPMRGELEGALTRIRLGEPVEEALEQIAERAGSRDFHWTVLAIRIQREVGGNLAEILDTVAETMVERERIRREVRTLTSEGRASAVILAAMPVALGLFIFMINRPYLEILTSSLSGQIVLLFAVVMELAGAWWMHRTIQVDV